MNTQEVWCSCLEFPGVGGSEGGSCTPSNMGCLGSVRQGVFEDVSKFYIGDISECQ